MRNFNIVLSLVVLSVVVVGQEIQLPDGSTVQGGTSSPAGQDQAKPLDVSKLPPPPPPPSLQGNEKTGQGAAKTATPASQAGVTQAEGDDAAQRAAAAMKAMGADPAKDPELLQKLILVIQQNRKTSALSAATTAQNGSPAQDAAAPQGSTPADTAAQQSGAGQTGEATGQAVTGAQSYASGCSTCFPSYTPSNVVVVGPAPCFETYPRVYVQRYSYPVYRSYPIGFRGFVSFGSGRFIRGR